MDFAQQQRNPSKHLIGITVVVVLHVLIVYALVTGLARKVIEVVKAPIETKIIEEVKKLPPPPDIPLPPPPKLEAPPPPYIPPPEIQVATPPPVNAITVQTTTPPPPQEIRPAPPAPTPAPAQPAGPVQIAAVCPTQPKPVLPRKALQEGLSGTVVARATIRGGKVVNVEVVRSNPRGLYDSAVRAAMSSYQCNASEQDIVAMQEFDFKIE